MTIEKLRMLRINHLLIIIVSILVLSCNGSKAYYKRAIQLEEAGMYKEASDYFLTALKKNPNNIEARIAIKKNGQQVLDQQLADFQRAYTAGEHEKAVYSYLKAKEFHQTVEKYAEINFAPYYKDYFEESKNEYLETKYNEAILLKEERKYEEANVIFAEIKKIDPDYQDVGRLEKVSRLEPIYLKAKEAMAKDQFREAYRRFDELLKSGEYKDASTLKEEALEEAIFSIAFLPSKYANSTDQEVADKFSSLLMEELLNLRSPFIRVIDRSNIDKILEEQKLALSGVVDSKSSAEAGKILGAKAVLSIKLISYNNERKAPTAVQRKGYQAVSVRRYNKATDSYYTETQYKKVYYKEVFGSNIVKASFRFNMSSSETAQILVSDLLSEQEVDRINYAIFDGDYKSLYPGTWKSATFSNANDKVFNDFKSKRALNQKFTNQRKSLKSTDEMRVALLQRMAREVALKIEAYDRSL